MEPVLDLNPPMPDATEAMVDLETLGTQPYSVILSIGACAFRFDQDPITDTFYQAITLESCLSLGLRVDASTIVFWMGQSDEARAAAFPSDAVTLPLALDAFTDWVNSRPLRIWGNSARFDMGLLEAAYRACGKEIPWKWSREGCYRTMKNLPGVKDAVPFQRVGTYHHALDDALSQADHLRKIFEHLHLQVR